MRKTQSSLVCFFRMLRGRMCAVYLFLFVFAFCFYSDPSFSPVQLTAYAAENDSITIYLKDGTKVTPCYTKEATVGAFIERLGATLGELDSVTPALDEPLEDGDVVKITRREYVIHKEILAIPYDTVYTHSPALKPGDESVSVDGCNGEIEMVYSRFLVNGEIVEQTLIDEKIILKPVSKEIHMGFRSVPVSKLDFEEEFDENDEPLNYTIALRDQRSAGYSTKTGALTASGRKATVGHVAVNPNIIPYGSRLFIQSSDGKYIYGYAIAADTGSSLMQGVIDVDCFYDTYQASANHGIKKVDIYILE